MTSRAHGVSSASVGWFNAAEATRETRRHMLHILRRADQGDGELIYFAHIGKTAGTSFRKSATRAIGARRCAALYSPDHRGADAELTRMFFAEFRRGAPPSENEAIAAKILARAAARRVRLFSTHHNPLFKRTAPPERTATFLREPLARLISHYNFSLSRGWTDPSTSFEAFATTGAVRNLQSRSLPLRRYDAIGLIGLTERYERSLDAFRHVFGVEVAPSHRNKTANVANAVTRADIPYDVVRRVRVAHSRDFELYERARADFEKRWGS
ncbi:MAG: hypothetical protein AAFU55_08730 [Pseudomonadota bacterium]